MNDQKVEAAKSSGTVPSSTVSTSPKGLGKQLGGSGTNVMGGIVTGDEYNQRLVGKFAIRQYEIMRRSEPSCEAALEVIKQPLLNVERRIDSAKPGDEEEDYRARFFHRELFDRNIDFSQCSEEALTFLDFGHAVMEFELELTEFEGKTRIGIKSLEFRKQISIDKWETKDKQPGITQTLSTPKKGQESTVSIPEVKLLRWVNKKEGENFTGVSLLRYCFKDWDFKDKLGILHAMGLEKMGVPTPVLGVPEGKENSQEVTDAISSLTSYRSNENAYILKPAGWELDKFDMSGQSISEFLPALQYYDRQIFMSVLAGFLALGANHGSGSRAVGEVQYKPYIQKLSTINKRFEAPFQGLIKLLYQFNFSETPNGYAQLKSGRFSDDDVAALANAISSLKNAGFLTPGIDDEKHLRKTLHMPDAPEGIDELYKLKFEQSKEVIKNPPPVPGLGAKPANPKDPGNMPPQPKPKKTEASVLRQAERSQRQLIDIIVRG
jgi:phage gp29-like protein